jgi:hypothetical protein
MEIRTCKSGVCWTNALTWLITCGKTQAGCERFFSTGSALEDLARSRIFLRFSTLTRQKIPRSRRRLSFATGC